MLSIELTGSSREIGRQRAELLRPVVVFLMERLLQSHSFGFAECAAWASRWRDETARLFPEAMEEIAGLADALGVGEDVAFAYNFRAWNALHSHPSHLACYNIGFTDPVEGPLLGGILEDGPPQVLEKVVPAQGHAFFSLTMPGTAWTVRGLNSEGLAGGQVSAFPGQPFRKGALAFGTQDYSRAYFLLRKALQAGRTVDDAIELFRDVPAIGTFMFADAGGSMAVVEKAGPLAGVRRCDGDHFTSGGHFLSEEVLLGLHRAGMAPLPPEASVRRQYAIGRLVEEHGPTLALMQRILTSDSPEDGGFCNDGAQAVTIAIPRRRQLLVAGYPPCRTGFRCFTFDTPMRLGVWQAAG